MMNAILIAVVRFFETVVTYSLGAVLIALCLVGLVGVSRWLLAERRYPVRTEPMPRAGSGSLALAAALAVGMVCVLAGFALWAR